MKLDKQSLTRVTRDFEEGQEPIRQSKPKTLNEMFTQPSITGIYQADPHKPDVLATHVKFKNIDGIVKIVRKGIIEFVDFDEDGGQATVFISEYDNETINEKEFIKLSEALTR